MCVASIYFRGDTAIVELLLLNGAIANSKDKKWLTPLHRACCSGNYNVVDYLLRYKADANARDRSWQTPLHVAAANNAVQCVELLIPHLLNINVTDRFVHFQLYHLSQQSRNNHSTKSCKRIYQ